MDLLEAIRWLTELTGNLRTHLKKRPRTQGRQPTATMAKFERWTQSGMSPQVAALSLDSQPQGADFINHSLISPHSWIVASFLSNPSSGNQSIDHTLDLQQPKAGREESSSVLIVRDKTELSARIHVVRIFLK